MILEEKLRLKSTIVDSRVNRHEEKFNIMNEKRLQASRVRQDRINIDRQIKSSGNYFILSNFR